MTKNLNAYGSDFVTSAGVRLSDVPEFARHDVEWMEGVHGAATDSLPSETDVPCPEEICGLPEFHPDRPRGSKAMIDVHGAKFRLKDLRAGAWLISPFTGWKWAVWPSGHIGWVPKVVRLPGALQVINRNDIH